MTFRNIALEPNIFRYIWMHTRREQIMIMLAIAVSMVPYYLALDLPKQIVNGPLQGMGFTRHDMTQPFMNLSLDLPFVGRIHLTDGIQLKRVPLLMALSLTFLALVVVNGLFKFYINVQKGRMGERLLRRTRYELVDRILRFPAARLRKAKAGEISSMVKDEIEPLGGFAGDAFSQPAMLGGQAVTALFFIFMQHFWLGMLAAFMAGVQAAIIPRMRRRLIILGRERQLTARELAGRVAEIVDGIQTVHTNDTTNWERADIAARLGRIFRIRYDIYQWKFLVKFLNNFLAQLTPFFFYSIGGYLTIKGTLDVGQLVAVINAYKELPGPLKELIDWDLARQDMQVKYEQVVEQFEAEGMIDPARQDMDAEIPAKDLAPLALSHVSLHSELGAHHIEDVSLSFEPGQSVALIGESSGGASVISDLLIGALAPSQGRVTLGDHDICHLPERVTGRSISYASAGARLVSGTILDNVTYGLKHHPGPAPAEDDRARSARAWRRRESLRAGNPDMDIDTDWLDPSEIQPPPDGNGLYASILTVLDVVGFGDEMLTMALRQWADADIASDIAGGILALRHDLHRQLAKDNLANAVLPFDPDRYNAEATVGENLLFGVPTDGDRSINAIFRNPFFARILAQTGLGSELFDMGRRLAQMTLELFRDMSEDPGLLQWLPYMTADQLPQYEQALERTRNGGWANATLDERILLIRLALSYVEPKYRFGLLDDKLRALVVNVRHTMRARMPAELHDQLQPYDADAYLTSATLTENILFGKINRRFGHAEERVAAAMLHVLRARFATDPVLRDHILQMGLAHDIGPDGRQLSQLQRQKLILARALIRRSGYYVFNEPLAGVDPSYQDRLIARILEFLADQPAPAGVIWVLANAPLAHHFGRVVEFSEGRIKDDTTVSFPDQQKDLRKVHETQ